MILSVCCNKVVKYKWDGFEKIMLCTMCGKNIKKIGRLVLYMNHIKEMFDERT